jgi:hypothetical protein
MPILVQRISSPSGSMLVDALSTMIRSSPLSPDAA